MSKPDIVIQYKDKASNVRATAGVGWLNDFGGANLKPETESRDGDFPSIPLVEAIQRALDGKGYLNLFAVGKGNRLSIEGAEDEGF